MATFDDWNTVKALIDNNGHYEKNWKDDPFADPPVMRITEYTNFAGNKAWGIVWPMDPINKYQLESPYVLNPIIIFEHIPHSDCNSLAGRK